MWRRARDSPSSCSARRYTLRMRAPVQRGGQREAVGVTQQELEAAPAHTEAVLLLERGCSETRGRHAGCWWW